MLELDWPGWEDCATLNRHLALAAVPFAEFVKCSLSGEDPVPLSNSDYRAAHLLSPLKATRVCSAYHMRWGVEVFWRDWCFECSPVTDCFDPAGRFFGRRAPSHRHMYSRWAFTCPLRGPGPYGHLASSYYCTCSQITFLTTARLCCRYSSQNRHFPK